MFLGYILSKVVLRPAVKKLQEIQVVPPLVANKCDHCLRIFENDNDNYGFMVGVFDKTPDAARGNIFNAQACSFSCADAIMSGYWQKLKGYEDYANFGAKLITASLKVASPLKTREDLISEWENSYGGSLDD